MELDLKKDIEEFDLVFLDLETTGLSIPLEDICEIAALKVRRKRLVAKFESLVNPNKRVSFGAYSLHGLSNHVLKDAPSFKEIAKQFLDFIDRAIVLAYNAEFDIGFLNQAFLKMDYPPLDTPVLDILLMAKRLVRLQRHNLNSLANFFKIEYLSAHRAVLDAEIAFKVFFKLKQVLDEKNIKNLGEYLCLFGVGAKTVKERRSEKRGNL